MATLRKLKGNYYAYFYDKHRTPKRKSYPLKVSLKSAAEKKLKRLEEEWAEGDFDPWNPGQRSEAMSVEEAAGRFMKSRSHLRPASLKAYRSALRTWKKTLPPDLMLENVDVKHVRSYIEDTSVKVSTRRYRYRHLNVFFNWAVEKEYLRENPLDAIRQPKEEKRLPEFLTPEQLQKILDTIDEDAAEKRKKGQAQKGEVTWLKDVILMAAGTGMRIGELTSLCWKAVERLFAALQSARSQEHPAETLRAKEEVYEQFQPIFSLEHLPELREHELAAFLKFENNRHWTGLSRSTPKMCRDMEALRKGLAVLVDEERPIAERMTEAVGRAHGMGKAIATAILHVAYPERYGVWNSTSEGGMKMLDIWPDHRHGSTIGERYERVNALLVRLAEDLDTDLWTLDALWWFFGGEEGEEEAAPTPEAEAEREKRFGLEQHLQEFLRDNWDQTELGREWKLYEADGDAEAGYEYPSKVGRIDLLARHREEPRWLVIELKRGQTSDRTVGQVLRYMGAVRRELAEEGDAVEGLIIAHEVSEKLHYALGEVPNVQLSRYEADFRLNSFTGDGKVAA